MKILALDLGKFNSQACILDTDSKNEVYQKLPTTPAVIHDLIVKLQPDQLVFEAGTPAGWIADLAKTLGVPLQVANSHDERWHWHRVKTKTDKTDALKLAKLTALGELPTIEIPNRDDRQLKKMARYRQQLIQRRTRIQNTIRSLFDAEGIALPRGLKSWTKQGLVLIATYAKPITSKLTTSDYWQGILSEELKAFQAINQQIAQVDKALRQRAKSCQKTQRLMTVPGIGQHLAEVLVAVIGNPKRFKSAKEIASYAGLTPRLRESGTMTRMGRISKRGDRLLRALLVEVAWISTRHNVEFKMLFDRYQQNSKQRRKKAVVALARHMLVIAWAMLRDETTWNPNKLMLAAKPG